MKYKLKDFSTKKNLFIFIIVSLMQFFVVLLAAAYFSYKDALHRSEFLLTSNENSLGLSMSVGDLFQIKNVVKSFRNELTPQVWILNLSGDNFLSEIDREKPPAVSDGFKFKVIQYKIFLLSTKAINYNGQTLGYLVTYNKLRIDDWIFIAAILLAFIIFGIYLQSWYLGRHSLSIARNIKEIENLFSFPYDKEIIEASYKSRRSTEIEEIENLAEKALDSLIKNINILKIEKEAAVGKIIAHLSHDMRVPLGVFEKILREPSSSFDGMREKVRESLNRINSMIESFRRSELEEHIRAISTDLNFSIALDSLIEKAERYEIFIVSPIGPIERVYVDPLKFERAWVNLVSNAIEAAKSEVRIDWERKGDNLNLRVIDDGLGVSENILPKLFERGATYGKADGTGLGLAYVRQVMRGHGGDVTYSRKDNFTIFECMIPNAFYTPIVSFKKEPSDGVQEKTDSAIKTISLCLRSPETAIKLKTALLEFTEIYSIINGYRSEASVVITDDMEHLERALDAGQTTVELKASQSLEQMIKRIKMRLGIRS